MDQDNQEVFRDIAEEAIRISMIAVFQGLGFNERAAEYLYDTQDINSIHALMAMDDTEIELLCKVCRSPGGTVQPRAQNGRLQPRIANPGVQIALRHENNLKLAVFYLKYQKMTSRNVDVELLTEENLNAIKSFKTEVLDREDPELDTAPKITGNNVFEFFEIFKDWLNEHTGSASKRPLGYVIRKTEEVPARDIPFGTPGTTYHDRYDEIEKRAPITVTTMVDGEAQVTNDEYFTHDNATVWHLLYKVLTGTGKRIYIANFKDTKDGRGAFLHLHDQLLGKDAISAAASRAENTLANTYLDPNKRFGLEQYIQRMMEQHILLKNLTKYNHSGIDENSKVRYFLQGIRDPFYSQMCTKVAGDAGNPSFDEVVKGFRSFKEMRRNTMANTKTPKFTVAVVDTKTGNHQQQSNRGPTPDSDGYDFNKNYDAYSVPDRYYKFAEWSNLTKGNRNYLRQRRARKMNKRKSDSITPEESTKIKRKLIKQKAKIMALTAQLTEARVSEESESDSSVEPPKRMKAAKKVTRIARKKN